MSTITATPPSVSPALRAARPVYRVTGRRVLIMTTFDLDEYVHAALRAGASGFLLKDARPDQGLTRPNAPG